MKILPHILFVCCGLFVAGEEAIPPTNQVSPIQQEATHHPRTATDSNLSSEDLVEIKLINGCRFTKEDEQFYLYIEPGCGRFGVVSVPELACNNWAVFRIDAILGGFVDLNKDGKLERKSLLGKMVRIRRAQQDSSDQPATAPKLESEGNQKSKPKSEGRSQ